MPDIRGSADIKIGPDFKRFLTGECSMRRLAAALAVSTLIVAPAFAGDIEIQQTGRSNWAAANQYNARNTVVIHQWGLNENGNNYASFAQTGRYNFVGSAQQSYTDNTLAVTQFGRETYINAFQTAPGVNVFTATQSRLRRR